MDNNKINPLWIAHNNLYNDGGEGYNPHDKYIVSDSDIPLWIKLDDKRSRILRVMSATSSQSEEYAEMEKEAKELEIAIQIELEKK